MIDNNLYGMNYLHSSDVVFRIGRDEGLNLDGASSVKLLLIVFIHVLLSLSLSLSLFLRHSSFYCIFRY